MSELSPVLGAALLSLMGHEVGHQAEADRLNVPMKWEGSTWYAMTQDKEALSKIAGAGVIMGQNMGEASPSLRLVSALNKLGYAAFPGSISSNEGDVNTIGKAKGRDAKHAAQVALVLSSLADFHKIKNPDRPWDIRFMQFSTGTPGLMLTIDLDALTIRHGGDIETMQHPNRRTRPRDRGAFSALSIRTRREQIVQAAVLDERREILRARR